MADAPASATFVPHPENGGHLDTQQPRAVLTCPECDTSMKQLPLGSVLLDQCMKCSGFWFEAGELTAALKEWPQAEGYRNPMDHPVESALDCPQCVDKPQLQAWNIHDLIVPNCTKCGGVFLAPHALRAFLESRGATAWTRKEGIPAGGGESFGAFLRFFGGMF